MPSISGTFLSRTPISEHSPCLDINSHFPESEYAWEKGMNRINNPQQHFTRNRNILSPLSTLHLAIRFDSA